MEGENNSGLFANDGSFLERFKQLQQQQQTPAQSPNSAISSVSVESPKTSMTIKKASSFKPAVGPKTTPAPSNGKLAFSLKQKSKLAVAPVKLGADEDDEDEGEDGKGRLEGQQKKQKLELADSSENSPDTPEHAPSPPNDPEVKKVADKLASFVAKNGRQFENITRQKNPGDTPFRFLFDVLCPDYKYYEYRVAEEEKALAKSRDSQNAHTASTSSTMSRQGNNLQKSTIQQQTKYHTPASALYDASCEDSSWSNQLAAGACEHSGERPSEPPPTAADPVAMMEYYMKKAAQEERRRPPKQTKDEMPPPPSLQTPQKRGHHMGDYIPTEELEKFLATCNDAAAQKAAREAAEKAKIQADNVGHRLLSKMGWKEGEGLGSGKTGRADPVQVGAVKLNNLGVGAEHPGEVTPEDDIYEQYKKRMMLGYRYRPNPLNNPRKAYY